MDTKLAALYEAMIEFFIGDPKRIQHFVKVHSFAKLICHKEGVDGKTLLITEAAALVHDCGIKLGEEKYGACSGRIQEELGPDAARGLLKDAGFDEDDTERVCYLVGHHHTYSCIDGIDYQILVEADFLVNIFEDDLKKEAAQNAVSKIFKTKSAIEIARTMFNL